MDKDLEFLFRVLRLKMEWIVGFSKAMENTHLEQQAYDVRRLLNEFERKHGVKGGCDAEVQASGCGTEGEA